MIIRKMFFLLFTCHSLYATPIAEQFKESGYVEIADEENDETRFNALYSYFDELIEFLQTNPRWEQKLYIAKERFIRSKDRSCYSTDFFGLYDESKRIGRSQISFYYSTHFHEFILARYPEFTQAPKILHFFEGCRKIQKPYGEVCNRAASELGIEEIFSSISQPPILLKVVKYLPSYTAIRPHYDGTAFSLFLHSTDSDSLLLSPYKPSFSVDDFSSPIRTCSQSENQKSILLIPGTFLSEFSIFPTPHIVLDSGQIRYATIAFAMRANYTQQQIELSPLPSFKD